MNVMQGKMKLLVLLVSVFPVVASAAALDTKTADLAHDAMKRGVLWLESHQEKDGRLGPEKYPAITALALSALKAAGSTNLAVLTKADNYLKHFLNTKTTDPLIGYNADICRKLLGLATSANLSRQHAAVDREYSRSAREFELRQIAWQKQRAELAKENKGDPDRMMAGKVAEAAVSVGLRAEGGKIAGSGQSTADSSHPTARAPRGYGSMTYQGMMDLLYDDVKADDPRVDAMVDWTERGFILDEREGKGQAGIFYFYHALSKCLNACGEPVIQSLRGGNPIQWREQLIYKLVSLQTKEVDGAGYWVNTDKTYMEGDPFLVTTYALLTLENALGGKAGKVRELAKRTQ